MKRAGFTLLELLVALVLLVTAFTIIWGSFSSATRAWKRGSEVVAGLHNGDFVMEQVVSALRSAAYFRSTRISYGFVYEDDTKDYPADRISWVTSSSALVPPDSPWARVTHRITLTIEDPGEGPDTMAVRAYSHVTPVEDEDSEIEPWFPAPQVRGLDCRIWDVENEEWIDEWTETNRIPVRVEIALYFEPVADERDPVILRRLVEIPLAALSTSTTSRAEIRTR